MSVPSAHHFAHNGVVALPRLALATEDKREIARVLRGALRLRVEVVNLVTPPVGHGHHLLDIQVPDGGQISLLAEPAGPKRANGYPLSVRPVTRVQMAELFALIERLDEPSHTMPPPAEEEDEYAFANDDGDGDGEDGGDDTMIDALSRTAGSAGPARILTPPAFEPPGIAHMPTAPPNRVSAFPRPRTPSAAPRPAPPPPPPVPGRKIDSRVGRVLAGKYFLEEPIGSGAMATVYRAMHKDLRRAVAVKILHAEHQAEAQFIRRFKSEALTASKLEHVNVTRIIDFGEERGELYLVMELVVGRSIEAVLAEQGPLPPKRVIDIGIQACRALAFAHGHGVIHRDIKPENIMLVPDVDDDGQPTDLVKVCDFGLAKLRGGGEEITSAGMLCGSPAYMSPEQTRGDELDARSDIYALGVTMFEALTGALPHEAFDIAELFVKKCTASPRKVSAIVEGVSPALEKVIDRAMSIDPHSRQPSARDLLAELRAAAAQL